MLITNATLLDAEQPVSVRIDGDTVTEVGSDIAAAPGEETVDALGNLLLPGLHDHHIHLLALAAALDSLRCGPPHVTGAEALASLLAQGNREHGGRWLRGIGYHPSVAGDIDRDWLDQHIPDRPARIQHRSGRLWVLNSAAIRELNIDGGNTGPAGLERDRGRPTGRLYDEDQWLREHLQQSIPDIGRASRLLASFGITSFTDTGPANTAAQWQIFSAAQSEGMLLQAVRMMGSEALTAVDDKPLLQRGELKIHLLESQLPDLEVLVARIREAHRRDRAVAIHCVTLAELEFSLNAWRIAGAMAGDRIEHGSVIAPDQMPPITELGLRVVTQPHFIAERGDQYRHDVSAQEQCWLYRCRSLQAHAVPVAFGSDAPFGKADPWQAMDAAVHRRCPSGAILGSDERVSPRAALDAFLGRADAPGLSTRRVHPGSRADLCLMDNRWSEIARDLNSGRVAHVWIGGETVFNRSD